jgi:DNA-binding NarL/FixJ family response regulator
VSTVVVCDTEPVAIEGLKTLLESTEGLRVVAAENSLLDGMDVVRELSPSMVVLDKAFGSHAVLDFLRMLRLLPVPTAAVVWGSSFSDAEVLRLIQAGSSGVVRKSAPIETLIGCLQTVATGATWTEEEAHDCEHESGLRPRSPLSARELQVMELVERGMKNRDIAVSLGIRTGTVKIHLKHIFEKTGIRGRYGLALSGLREKGLLAYPKVGTV